MTLLRYLQFWLLLFGCLMLSLMPQPPEAFDLASDKLWHALAYLVLYLSCRCAYRQRLGHASCFALLLGFSLLIEVLQHFVPNREFSLLDMLANAAGLGLGIIMVWGVAKWKREW